MFFASSAAPSFFASNGETCLYSVPTCARSSSSSTGAEIAPGMWSSANSAGERQSMMVSKEEKSIFSMRKFYAMNAPEKIRLTEFSHGGGCGCKIAPAVLSEILASSGR